MNRPDAPPVTPPRIEPAGVAPDTVIAIDGPAGSGKSTTARALARAFGLCYVDTGAMYRALTWAALEAGVPPADAGRLGELLRAARLELRPGETEALVLWDGRDVSAAIRTPAVEAAVSAVSAHGEVRRQMVERQRALGRSGGVVMEGRDIGSAVFPLATVKLYLDATPEARAGRRARQHQQRGLAVDRAAVAADLAARDRLDSGRAESPLTIPVDAAVLDTSPWDLEQQIDRALATARELAALRLPHPVPPHLRTRDLPERHRLVFAFFGALGRFYGLRTYGREHLDLPAGVIIAANHLSLWDPLILGATLQRAPVNTLAKAELFRFPLSGAVLRWIDTIPIQRRGFDATAFQAAVACLDAGEAVAVFPEGTRRPTGRPGPVRSGLGILMQRSGAPTVPVFLRGTTRLSPGGSPAAPLEVRYAPAVRLHALPALRARCDERQICGRIATLFQAIYAEMQARSWAERPQTDEERIAGEEAVRRCDEREARIFGRRRPAAPGGGDSPAGIT